MGLEFTENQEYVLRAVYELRVEKRTRKLEHGWIEERTSALKIQEGEEKTNKVSRQQWTAPYNDTPADKVWERIGEAVRNRLAHNDPIEQKIRAYKSSDSVLVAELKAQILTLETRVEEAEAVKLKAIAEYEEWKSKYYSEQCTDAHYRINFTKVMNANETFQARIKADERTIKGLTSTINVLNEQIALLEARLSDGDLGPSTGAVPIKRPQVLEPIIVGTDESLEHDELLRMYEKAIDVRLDDLAAVAKMGDLIVTIVFHNFNIDTKVFLKEGKIPLRSARMDNIVFACHGATPEIRTYIFHRISALSSFTPWVVHVSGTGKVEHLPVKERNGLSNHDWFVSLVRTKGAFRPRIFNAENEGYDTVIYRRLDDGK